MFVRDIHHKMITFENSKNLLFLMEIDQENSSKLKKWLQRIGWIGVAFFTLKGLVWLVVFYYGAESLKGCIGN